MLGKPPKPLSILPKGSFPLVKTILSKFCGLFFKTVIKASLRGHCMHSESAAFYFCLDEDKLLRIFFRPFVSNRDKVKG